MTAFWQARGQEVVDISLYRRYGERILDGAVPYRDFSIEYPPGALPSFIGPALVTTSHGAYYVVFSALMAALGAMAVVALGRLLAFVGASAREQRATLALIALAPLALGGVILTRFDLLPVLVVLASLTLLLGGRERAGFFVLGAGIAVKLYPIVMLPILATWVWRRAGARRASRRVAEALVVPVAAYAAFAVLSPGGVGESIWRQLSRALQIESVVSGVLLVAHNVFSLPLSWQSSSGSQNLDGLPAGFAAAVTSLVQIALLVATWVLFARGPASSERMLRFSVAAVAVFVVFGKVLSPQFLLWLLFLVPLVRGPGARQAMGCFAGAVILTGVWFPALYWDLVKTFDPLSAWLVLLRGVLLCAFVLVLLFPDVLMGRARGAARLPSPVP